jgi:hypothetical protein
MKKPVINYVLEAKSKKASERRKPELITARVSGGWCEYLNEKKTYQTFKVSLKCTIKPLNFGKQENNYKYDEVIFTNFSKSNAGVKNAMRQLESKIDKVYSNFLLHDKEASKDEFRDELFIQLNKTKRAVKQNMTIGSYLGNKISYFESLIGSGQKKELSDGRIKTFRTLLFYINKYNFHYNTTLTFEALNEKVYREFWNFQDDVLRGNIALPKFEGKRGQQIKVNGFSVNGIIKYQKALVLICKQAKSDNIAIALDITDPNLILEERPTSKDIFIDEANLKKIIAYKAIEQNIQNAKDYVLLASMTGMRYESMIDATNEKIEYHKDNNHEFSFIHSDQGKTQTECVIPLLPTAMEILKANGNSFPKFPDNSTLNFNIKSLFAKAQINISANLTNYTFRGGVIKEIKKVSEIVSSHDMRKAFYTNLSNYGLSQTIIEYVTHPNKTSTSMASYYDKRTLINKAVQFVDEVDRLVGNKSELYRYS